MSEALTLIKKFSFDDLELHRIEAACLQKNERSLKSKIQLEY